MKTRWLMALLLVSGAVLADTAPIQVTDARGERIELAQPAERIIALAPHIVENLYSAGAGDKLIAAVSYSDYPPQAQSLPRVGSYKTVNYEEIVALQPDLVIGWASGNGEALGRQLERLGLTVYIDELRSLQDIPGEIRTLGKLAGTSPHAEQIASAWEQRLGALQRQYARAEPVSVLYQVWNNPLQTLNGEHLVSDVIRLCGGRNAFADAVSLAPKINIESVLARNPDAIVASGMGEQRPDWLDEWKQYPALSAVENRHLYFVPPDIIQRHTMRILDGAELLCEHLQAVRQRQ